MKVRPAVLFAVSLLLPGCTLVAQESNHPSPRHIALDEAVQLALKHNHVVRIAGYKIEEKEHAKDVTRSAYFPILRNDSNVLNVTDTQFIAIPAGSLGTVGGTPLPERSVILNQGGHSFVTSGTGLTQPLTGLLKVKSANDIALAELNATRDKARQTENAVALRVHQLYYRILIADAHRAGQIRQHARGRGNRKPRTIPRSEAGSAQHGTSALGPHHAIGRCHRLAAHNPTNAGRRCAGSRRNLRTGSLPARSPRSAPRNRRSARGNREGVRRRPSRQTAISTGCGGVRPLQLPGQCPFPGP